jgi:hypothetical protein
MSAREVIKGYASLRELVHIALTAPCDAPKDRASRRGGNGDGYGGGGDKWAGGSWEDAKKRAQNGDIEGARRLRVDVLAAVNAMVTNMPRLDPVYKLDEGQWVDVARYVKGEPECWGSMIAEETAPKKGAAVIVNVAASASISASALDRLGVSIGSAILGMQAQGFAVVLHAAQKIQDDGTMLVHAPVNPGGCPLDIAHMSVILRPWFLRRIIFSLEETYTKELRDRFGISSYGGYGQPSYITKADAKIISGRDNAVVINAQDAVKNPEGVKDLILRQFKGGK